MKVLVTGGTGFLGFHIVQELLARLRAERGGRVTMQDALGEALRDWCAKHDVTLI